MNTIVVKAKPLSVAIAKAVEYAAAGLRAIYQRDAETIYEQAQKDFEYIVNGGPLVNLAPVLPGQPLQHVEAEDHEVLRKLGALQRDGKWLMPTGLTRVETWQFAKWFFRAPPDLEIRGTTWEMTSDGRPTNGYIISEDLFRGTDSTATSILMGAFPALFATGYCLWQLPIVGPYLALGVCGPLLAAHMSALSKAENWATVARLIALSGAMPLLLGLGSSATTGSLLPPAGAIAGAAGMALLFALGGKSNSKSAPVFTFWTRLKHGMAAGSLVLGLNYGLGLLPPSWDWLKPFGLYAMACAYPLYYTLGNWTARTHMLSVQSKLAAGANTQGTLLGLDNPVRYKQIRSSNRDNSSFIALGRSKGVIAKTGLVVGAEEGQVLGYSLVDSSTHTIIVGETGRGKTANGIYKILLALAAMREHVGVFGADGKWALVADTRPFWHIRIEPGTKFAPFQGMTSLMVANAFAEANNESMDDKDSIWVKTTGTAHRYALAILEALVEQEKKNKSSFEDRLFREEKLIEDLVAEKLLLQRTGQPTDEVEARLEAVKARARTLLSEIDRPRVFRWTPASYKAVMGILTATVKDENGMWRPSDKAQSLFDYLGHKASEQRLELDPFSVNPHVSDHSRVISNAISYYEKTWIEKYDPEHRSSFMLNMEEDIQGFFQNDDLRGSMIEGVDCGDEAWSDTEEGVDVLQVLHGKNVGVSLSERYGKTGKVIYKLAQTAVYNAVQERNEKYGKRWMEKTGQSYVYDVKDECQDLISPIEDKLSAKARSMGLHMIYATQTFESLDAALKGDDGKRRFLNNFLNRIVFGTSAKTYTFLQEKAGVALKLKVPVKVQQRMDTKSAIEAWYSTSFADPNHPNAVALRDMDRRGATRLQVMVQGVKNFMGMSRRTPIDEMPEQNYLAVSNGGTYVEAPILEMTDLTATLAEEGSALLYLNRAGHPRIEFADMEYISNDEFEKRLAAIRAKKAEAASTTDPISV